MQQLIYRHLTDDDKRHIWAWKYDGEYEIYNLPPYEEMKAQQIGFREPKSEQNYLAFADGDTLV